MNRQSVLASIRDASLTPVSYSGRGMFGKRCLGVACQPFELQAKDACWDQLGKGMIVYWPSLEPPTEKEIEDCQNATEHDECSDCCDECFCDLENGECSCS